MNQIRTYPDGVTSWVDLQVDDAEVAKAFYGGLFGWTFTDVGPPGADFFYVIAHLDGQDVAGIGGPASTGSWHTYIAAEDAEATAKLVVGAGGRMLSAPEAAGEAGVSAVCADPTGAEFRLWQAKNRPGAQIANVPGAWNFSQLHTSAPGAAKDFYAAVFGWEYDDNDDAALVRRPGYGDHLASTIDPDIYQRQEGLAPPGFADATAWIATLPAGDAARWHVAFTVADRDQTAATATRLGATVVSTNDTEWTKEALLRDPQGAEFTASQFTPPG